MRAEFPLEGMLSSLTEQIPCSLTGSGEVEKRTGVQTAPTKAVISILEWSDSFRVEPKLSRTQSLPSKLLKASISIVEHILRLDLM